MIIDMPLPMPRWLISSPIHISDGGAADEGDDHEVAARPHAVGEQLDVLWQALGRAEERVAVAVAEDERERRGLQRGDADGEVARVLRDLALTDRALLLELLQLGDDHTEHLHDDARGDVRHDARARRC